MGKRGRPPHDDILTPREWEVLALLRLRLSNPEIAERLGISRDGAKYHVSEILGKLGLESREQAARWRYEDAGPWWATAFVPFLPGWRRLSSMLGSVAGSAAKVVSIAVLGLAIGGIGLLALLLYLQSGEGGDSPLVTPDGATSQLMYRDAEGLLWLVDADGTRERFAEDDTCASSSMRWSPTGETLVCSDERRIELHNGDGELIGEVQLSNGLEFGRFEWSPTGDTFLYTVRDEGPFYIVDRTGDIRWQVGPWDRSLSGYGTAPHGLALWSNDGTRIAYRVSRDEDAGIRVFSFETEEQAIDGDYYPLGWALGGESLLIAANYEPPPEPLMFPSYEVSVLDIESGDRLRIPELDNGVQFWTSPDGSSAVALVRGQSPTGLAIIDLRNGEYNPIPNSVISNPTESIGSSQIKFSHDGDQIYWVDTGAPATVYMASADGTGLTKLAEVPALGARLSPDLTRIAYNVFDDDVDSMTFYVADVDGENIREIDFQSFAGQSRASRFQFAWRPVPR